MTAHLDGTCTVCLGGLPGKHVFWKQKHEDGSLNTIWKKQNIKIMQQASEKMSNERWPMWQGTKRGNGLYPQDMFQSLYSHFCDTLKTTAHVQKLKWTNAKLPRRFAHSLSTMELRKANIFFFIVWSGQSFQLMLWWWERCELCEPHCPSEADLKYELIIPCIE